MVKIAGISKLTGWLCTDWGSAVCLTNLNYRKAIAVRRQVYYYFGRSMFYRILHKERHVTPSEQEHIRQIFVNNGIDTEPVYDEYQEEYSW